jgi:thioredoxin-related protein
MDKQTYTNPEVVSYINEHYHAVKFDAEQKGDITLGDKTFKYIPNVGRNGIHELAVAILGNRPSYPTTVFFDEKLQKLTNVPGFLKPADMMPILTYFGEDIHKTGKDYNVHLAEYNKSK